METTEVITDDILTGEAKDIVEGLKKCTSGVPAWDELEKQYNPKKHPVYNKSEYPDLESNGKIEKVTRIAQDLQRLAVKRTTELIFGVPVKRIYKPETDKQKEIAKAIETILQRNRINSVNIERSNMLYASCEVATLWFAVEEKNTFYGFDSGLKLRCKSYSPKSGDELYVKYDEYGDMVAMAFGYKQKSGDKDVEYMDVYTAQKHVRYVNSGEWEVDVDEAISIGKIPVIYCSRPSPAWEDASDIVYEIEWALSRNGNYLRKNSKPLIGIFADKAVDTGKEKNQNEEFKAVFQFPSGSDVKYVTWDQAIENLKFYVAELRQSFFTQLQLPDFSFESMKTTPMSGEARKMIFVDAQLKVTDESGRLLEFLDREINIVKAFLKIMMKNSDDDIDALQVENIITPFSISDDKDTISNIMLATGGKAIMSQLEGIKNLGWSDNPDETLKQIQTESAATLGEPTLL